MKQRYRIFIRNWYEVREDMLNNTGSFNYWIARNWDYNCFRDYPAVYYFIKVELLTEAVY